MPVPMTPEQIETLVRVYLETANAAEAARSVGVDPSTARKALKRLAAPERSRVYARTLDAALQDAGQLQRVALNKLRKDLKVEDVKVRHSATGALNDTVRALSLSRTAAAKLSGEHAPERLDVHVELTVEEALATIAELEGKARG